MRLLAVILCLSATPALTGDWRTAAPSAGAPAGFVTAAAWPPDLTAFIGTVECVPCNRAWAAVTELRNRGWRVEVKLPEEGKPSPYFRAYNGATWEGCLSRDAFLADLARATGGLQARGNPAGGIPPGDGGAKPAAVTRVSSPTAAVAGTLSEAGGIKAFNSPAPALVPRDPRPGHWSYPGDIASHLRRAHGIDPAGLSREQMLTAHDLAHERGWRPSLSSVPRSVSPAPRYVVRAASCPSGRCPNR